MSVQEGWSVWATLRGRAASASLEREYCFSLATRGRHYSAHLVWTASGTQVTCSCSSSQCIASWWWLLWPCNFSHPWYCTGKWSNSDLTVAPVKLCWFEVLSSTLYYVLFSLRCSGVWIRSWLRGSTFPLWTGWSATANTLALWMSIMTSTSLSLCPCVPRPRRSCRRRRTWLRSCSSSER